MPASNRYFTGTSTHTAALVPGHIAGVLTRNHVPMYHHSLTRQSGDYDLNVLMEDEQINSTVERVYANKNYGKTADTIMLANRLRVKHVQGRQYRVYIEDMRTRDGEPEYERLCQMNGYDEINIAKMRLNLMDMKLPFTFGEQFSLMEDTFSFATHTTFGPYVSEALLCGIMMTRTLFPDTASTPLLLTCLEQLGTSQVLEYRGKITSELSGSYAEDKNFQKMRQAIDLQNYRLEREELHKLTSDHMSMTATEDSVREVLQAARWLATAIRVFLQGTYGEMFGGDQSLAEVLQRLMVVINYGGIEDDNIMMLVQQLLWRIKLSAVNRGDYRFFCDADFFDENPEMWRYPTFARPATKYVKRIRSTGTWVRFIAHRWTDQLAAGDAGTEVFERATAIDDDINLVRFGALPRKVAYEMWERYGLSTFERDLMIGLNTPGVKGRWLIKAGEQPCIDLTSMLNPYELWLAESNRANKRRTWRRTQTPVAFTR